MPSSDNGNVSIIIAVHNEEENVEECIFSCLNQTEKPFEVIVVNDGSTDRTADIVNALAEKEKRIKLINFTEGHSAAFARNRGVEKAKGNILIFVDGDHVLSNTVIEKIKEALKRTKCEALTIPVVGHPKRNFFQSIYEARRRVKSVELKGAGIPICIKKETFLKIGGYDESVFYFEDWDFCQRLVEEGVKIGKVEDATVFHKDPKNFNEFIRQTKWAAKGIFTFKRMKLRDKFNVFAPMIFWDLFLVSFIAALFSKIFLFLFVLLLSLLVYQVGKHIVISKMVLPTVAYFGLHFIRSFYFQFYAILTAFGSRLK